MSLRPMSLLLTRPTIGCLPTPRILNRSWPRAPLSVLAAAPSPRGQLRLKCASLCSWPPTHSIPRENRISLSCLRLMLSQTKLQPFSSTRSNNFPRKDLPYFLARTSCSKTSKLCRITRLWTGKQTLAFCATCRLSSTMTVTTCWGFKTVL